jgi:hypothetical protein
MQEWRSWFSARFTDTDGRVATRETNSMLADSYTVIGLVASASF